MPPNRLAPFLRLIRVENLAIIALTQILVRFFIVIPVFELYKLPLALNNMEYILFILATLCIAAAGYIINDYFDVSIDSVNKPMQVMVGNIFSKKEAFRYHLILNFIGSLLGLYAGWQAGNYKLGFVFIMIAGLLWFYATSFKKMFLIGNLIVSFTAAMVILTIGFFETTLFKQSDFVLATAANIIMMEILAYSFFAFLTTLIREIIKDMQDIKGDAGYGCKTVPVVLGLKNAKTIVTILCGLLIGLLFYLQKLYFPDGDFMKIAYIFIAIQLPVVALVFNLVPAQTAEEFGKMSTLMKIIILLGILSMVVFSFVK